jgi:hypothetical protein
MCVCVCVLVHASAVPSCAIHVLAAFGNYVSARVVMWRCLSVVTLLLLAFPPIVAQRISRLLRTLIWNGVARAAALRKEQRADCSAQMTNSFTGLSVSVEALASFTAYVCLCVNERSDHKKKGGGGDGLLVSSFRPFVQKNKQGHIR